MAGLPTLWFLAIKLQFGLDELIEIAGQHFVRLMTDGAGSMVLYLLIRMKYVRTYLIPPFRLDLGAEIFQFTLLPFLHKLEEFGFQQSQRFISVG